MKKASKAGCACPVKHWVWLIVKILLAAYAILFTIFYFNLDTKLFYRVMPILNKYHYDVMPSKDFAESIKGNNQ